jgi:hypothetical protein
MIKVIASGIRALKEFFLFFMPVPNCPPEPKPGVYPQSVKGMSFLKTLG